MEIRINQTTNEAKPQYEKPIPEQDIVEQNVVPYRDQETFRRIKVKWIDEGVPGSGIKIGNGSNYAHYSKSGSLVFVGTAGMAFGEIYVKDNTTITTLNSAAKVQIIIFANNGESNNTTTDYTNGHITITKAGKYLVTVSLSVNNNASQAHKVNFAVWKNNGSVEYTNLHADRSLSGGSLDVGAISMSGIIDVSVNDTIEVWVNTGTAADRDITVEDANLSILQISG